MTAGVPPLGVAFPSAPTRVSYVLPDPASSPPRLALPATNVSKLGRSAPIYVHAADVNGTGASNGAATPSSQASVAPSAKHPRHRLAVQALALDMSTSFAPAGTANGSGSPAPRGLLYTGARDGLVASWDLGLPTKRRTWRYGVPRRHESVDADEDDSDEEALDDDAIDEEDDEGDDASWQQLNALDLNSIDHRNGSGPPQRTNAPPRRRRGSADTARRREQKSQQAPAIPYEHEWEIDQSSLPEVELPPGSFRQGIQSHTDWINDMVLVNYNRTVVSASSDSLVLAWNPHAADPQEAMKPRRIGRHTDYVRRLTSARDASWVASAGFDRCIKLWDVGEGRDSAVVEMTNTPGSVYSLATTPSGSLVGAGSPEKFIRFWDPRTRKPVARLQGHTDNVRDLLIAEDGRWALSASSDSTVKLWSLAAQKCLHTFSYHSSSVWSLFSQHPSLEVFYSGDRNGVICKTDLEGCGEPSEGECVALARDASMDEREYGSNEGVQRMVAQDDTYVWSAGGSSHVKRWRDIPRRLVRAMRTPRLPATSAEAVRDLPGSAGTEAQLEDLERSPSRSTRAVSFADSYNNLSRQMSSPLTRQMSPAVTGSAQSMNGGPASLRGALAAAPAFESAFKGDVLSSRHRSASVTTRPAAPDTLFEIPYASLVPLTSPEDPLFASYPLLKTGDPDAATIYSTLSNTSMSLARASGSLFHQTPRSLSARPRSLAESKAEQAAGESEAVRDYNERELADDATPLHCTPEAVLEGTNGLIRCEMLNDRRHVLTIDTQYDVAVWDIVGTMGCIGVFPRAVLEAEYGQIVEASSVSTTGEDANSGHITTSGEILELVRARIESEGAGVAWCKADTKTGSLSVHVEESRAFDADMYIDEIFVGPDLDFPLDHRVNLGKIVLRNLFDRFIESEISARQMSASPVNSQSSRCGSQLSLDTSDSALRSPDQGRAPPPGTLDLSGAQGGADDSAPPSAYAVTLATPAPSRALPPVTPAGEALMASPRHSMFELPGDPLAAGAALSPSATPHLSLKTPMPGSDGKEDYFSRAPPSPSIGGPAASKPADNAPAPTPGGGFMGRLRSLGKSKSKQSSLDVIDASPTPAPIEEEDKNGPAAEAKKRQEMLETVFSTPLTPPAPIETPLIAYNESIAINVAEEAQGSAWTVTYRGLVGSAGRDRELLEQKLAGWQLDFLLHNRVIEKPPLKTSFLLQPYQDVESAGLPELLNAHARLTANRNLRIRKVALYVADKVSQLMSQPAAPSESSVSDGSQNGLRSHASMSSLPNGASTVDEDSVEILVGDLVLPAHVTLASVRMHHWKTGGLDVVLSYRRKAA